MGAVEAYSAGFTAQVSVVPPGAKVSPNSKLSEADAGKVPGIRGIDGTYHGYNWLNSQPLRDTVAQWVEQGSSVGFLSSHYPALDIDIMNAEISDAVVEAVEDEMGPGLVRTGRAPKRLIIFRCDEPLRSFDMHYSRWSDLLGTEDRQLIQFMGAGKQYVMFGTHPVTMQPYTITDPGMALVLGPVALPTLTTEGVVRLFDRINRVMESFGYVTTNSAEARLHGVDVCQDDLKAPSLIELGELVQRIPNITPDRDEYVAVGYAIKAASQDDPEAGFSMFMDWCERWEQGVNDPAVVRRDWDKMVPPYRTGYDWLIDRAKMWGANVSDIQFGQADPRPEGAPGAELLFGGDPEVAAATEALQAATADDDAMLSDRWLARKFVAQFGKHYMIPRGMSNDMCLKWDGMHWVEIPRGQLHHHVASFMAAHTSIARQAYENPKDGAAAAVRLGSAWAIRAVATLVESSPVLAVTMGSLDADPDVLDTPAGPIHLPTGELLKPDPVRRLTKATSVSMDPSMHCPRWLQFIDEVTMGDKSLAFWLQCLAGYSITGHTREQIFPFFVGPGGNGKSVFVSTLSRLLGSNAVSVPVELFQLGRGNGSNDVPYLLASIHGARLITTSETKAGGMWDEQRVKQVTGEDTITARVPYGKPFTFEASCTLIVAGNHSPDLEEVTDAMVRRIRVMSWEFVPKVFDKMLSVKLAAELPGILAWCVQGAMAWYTHGMPECTTINRATTGYLLDQDTMGNWADNQLVIGRRDEILPTRELYDNYVTWCRVNAVAPARLTVFQKRIIGPLRMKGAVRTRTSEVRGWRNVKLRPVAGDVPSNVVNFPAVAPAPPQR